MSRTFSEALDISCSNLVSFFFACFTNTLYNNMNNTDFFIGHILPLVAQDVLFGGAIPYIIYTGDIKDSAHVHRDNYPHTFAGKITFEVI